MEIVNYVIKMVPFMLLFTIVYGLCRFFYMKNKEINWFRELGMLLFFNFLVGLFSVAVIRDILSAGFSINNISVNWIPFRIIIETYEEVVFNHNITYLFISFLGNIGMFMPIGFCLPLLFKKMNFKNTILFTFLCSLLIEVNQLFLPRITDIDDLICNTFGGIIGYGIYYLFSKRSKKLKKLLNSE